MIPVADAWRGLLRRAPGLAAGVAERREWYLSVLVSCLVHLVVLSLAQLWFTIGDGRTGSGLAGGVPAFSSGVFIISDVQVIPATTSSSAGDESPVEGPVLLTPPVAPEDARLDSTVPVIASPEPLPSPAASPEPAFSRPVPREPVVPQTGRPTPQPLPVAAATAAPRPASERIPVTTGALAPASRPVPAIVRPVPLPPPAPSTAQGPSTTQEPFAERAPVEPALSAVQAQALPSIASGSAPAAAPTGSPAGTPVNLPAGVPENAPALPRAGTPTPAPESEVALSPAEPASAAAGSRAADPPNRPLAAAAPVLSPTRGTDIPVRLPEVAEADAGPLYEPATAPVAPFVESPAAASEEPLSRPEARTAPENTIPAQSGVPVARRPEGDAPVVASEPQPASPPTFTAGREPAAAVEPASEALAALPVEAPVQREPRVTEAPLTGPSQTLVEPAAAAAPAAPGPEIPTPAVPEPAVTGPSVLELIVEEPTPIQQAPPELVASHRAETEPIAAAHEEPSPAASASGADSPVDAAPAEVAGVAPSTAAPDTHASSEVAGGGVEMAGTRVAPGAAEAEAERDKGPSRGEAAPGEASGGAAPLAEALRQEEGPPGLGAGAAAVADGGTVARTGSSFIERDETQPTGLVGLLAPAAQDERAPDFPPPVPVPDSAEPVNAPADVEPPGPVTAELAAPEPVTLESIAAEEPLPTLPIASSQRRLSLPAGTLPPLSVLTRPASGREAQDRTTVDGGSAEPVSPESDSTGFVMPQVTRQVAPVYPVSARRSGNEGDVLVEVDLGETGVPQAARVIRSSGIPAMDAAAQRAVLEWRFTPARRDGMPIPYTFSVLVVFQIAEP